MKALDYPAKHNLNAAAGWLDLGNPEEAKAEVDRIPLSKRFHPDVFVMRWRIYARAEDWAAAHKLARIFAKRWPDRPAGWLCHAYSLHKMNRTLEAFMCLLPQARVFPTVSAIPFLLACFCRQMGNTKEADLWLGRSAELGEIGRASCRERV